MCNPVALALVVTAAQQRGERQQIRYQNQIAQQNEKSEFAAASTDAQRAYRALADEQAQQEASAAVAIQATRKEGLQLQASSIASSGGTAGIDAGVALADYERQKITGIRNQETSLRFSRNAAEFQRENVFNQHVARRNQAQYVPILGSDYFTQALQLVGAGATAYYASGDDQFDNFGSGKVKSNNSIYT